MLLACAVERAAGQPLGVVARRLLFDPLGMATTHFVDAVGLPSTPGWSGGRRVDVRFTCVGDGGLVTSLADLARWDGWLPTSPVGRLMLGDRPVLADGWVADDAWGISVRGHHGTRIESHGGAIAGYLAKYVRIPTAGCSVVMLANTDELGVDGLDARVRSLVGTVAGEVLDPTLPPWTETHGRPCPR